MPTLHETRRISCASTSCFRSDISASLNFPIVSQYSHEYTRKSDRRDSGRLFNTVGFPNLESIDKFEILRDKTSTSSDSFKNRSTYIQPCEPSGLLLVLCFSRRKRNSPAQEDEYLPVKSVHKNPLEAASVSTCVAVVAKPPAVHPVDPHGSELTSHVEVFDLTIRISLVVQTR